jgi:membrane fusion protein, heavy metal efflux system
MKKWINILQFGLFALLFVNCGSNKTEIKEEKHEDHAEKTVHISPTQMKNNQIILGNATQKVLSGVLKVNGMVHVPPQNLLSVSAKMGGFLRHTDLLPGSVVRQGQLLAVIENQDFILLQQEYLDAQSRLTFQQLEYERQKQLSAENVNARKVFQQVSSELGALQAKIKGLEARLSLVNLDINHLKRGNIVNAYNIYAPTNGIVTTVNVNIGKFVQPQDVLFEISNTEHLHIELTIFEQDIPKVKVGQKVRFTLVNQPEKEHFAKVYLINPQVNADRSIQIHCHAEPAIPDLSPNTFLKALIELDQTSVKALPDEAFVQEEGKDYVFITSPIPPLTPPKGEKKEREKEPKGGKTKAREKEPKGGKTGGREFEMIEVKKGISEGGFTEVIFPEKMPKDFQIVTKGAITLLAQLKNASGEEEGHGH